MNTPWCQSALILVIASKVIQYIKLIPAHPTSMFYGQDALCFSSKEPDIKIGLDQQFIFLLYELWMVIEKAAALDMRNRSSTVDKRM
jgi:hypothetical protein